MQKEKMFFMIILSRCPLECSSMCFILHNTKSLELYKVMGAIFLYASNFLPNVYGIFYEIEQWF